MTIDDVIAYHEIRALRSFSPSSRKLNTEWVNQLRALKAGKLAPMHHLIMFHRDQHLQYVRARQDKLAVMAQQRAEAIEAAVLAITQRSQP